MRECANCGATGLALGFMQHYRQSPLCRPPREIRNTSEEPPQKRGQTSSGLFRRRVVARFRSLLWNAHFEHYFTESGLALVQSIVVSILLVVLEYISSEVPTSRAACEEVSAVIRDLSSARSVLAQAQRKLQRVEPLVFKNAVGAGKDACFFSLIQLMTVMLQESAEVRRHAVAASEA